MSNKPFEFRATSADGAEFTVVGTPQPVSFTALSGRRRTLGGAIDYKLDDGRDVSITGDPDVFRIVDTEELIERKA